MSAKAFSPIEAVAAPLPLANIDTDKILPAEFLKTVERCGLGKSLFHAMRFLSDGSPCARFVLNREPWTKAGILVALDNFGSGSSREHAPWALSDFGIRVIIAPSFADIFRQNCIKNCILPAVVSREAADAILELVADPEQARLKVDLPSSSITSPFGRQWSFEIDEASRQALAAGENEIDASYKYLADIENHISALQESRPWLLPVTW